MSLPPGPKSPSAVQLMQFTYRPLAYFEEVARRYGDPFTMRVAGLGTYVGVASPELIKQVFTGDPEQLHAGEANRVLEPIVGRQSVLLLDGKPHARQRKLLLPPLHGERMQAYARVMSQSARAALAQMPRGQAFSLHPFMQSATLDIILVAVFGMSEGAAKDRLKARLIEFLRVPPIWATFLPPRLMDFPLSPYRAFLSRLHAVDAQLFEIIRERRTSPGNGTDILSLLMSARDEAGEPMTEPELRDELVTLLVAGHETTATALSWAMACLLDTPSALERLEGELAGVSHGGEMDTAAVTKLEYLDAVVKESLRLRPILIDVVRRVKSPISVAGYEVPPGVNLMPVIYLAHRNPKTYPEPERFKPERFLGVKPEPYAWLPFGGGLRRCIGMAFALEEIKLVLAELLLGGRFHLAAGRAPKAVRRTITLAPEGGTRVVLEERTTLSRAA
jgi:cytochrome P450